MPHKDPEAARQYRRLYYQRNKDAIRQRYRTDREKILTIRRKYETEHREEFNARMRDYRAKNTLDLSMKRRLYIEEKRRELMQILGGMNCIRCGFLDFRALQFDHKNGDGMEDRTRIAPSSLKRCMYYINHPEEARAKLQVLCANCNWIKRYETGEYLKLRLSKLPSDSSLLLKTS